MNDLESVPNQQHFVLVPLFSQGHMIPMLDMARVLASHGVFVSFLTSPLNASRIQTSIDKVKESGLSLNFVSINFPCKEAGLPEGCENTDVLPSRNLIMNFIEALEMLKEPLISYLYKQNLPPSCIISDINMPWTGDVAREFGIPRFSFNGYCGFASLAAHIIRRENVFENVKDDKEIVVLSGFPIKLELTRAKSPSANLWPGFEKFKERIVWEEERVHGIVVNSFYELESLYIDSYAEKTGQNVYPIGPMLLCNKGRDKTSSRGNKSSIDEVACLDWLDSMKPHSVIYVSFGSLANMSTNQLIEICLGLEASSRPFILVDKSSKSEEWLSNGFEERVKDRGLIIRGWAPQAMILSHPSVGGFMTHCGWNSTLESICYGLPMITWPSFAEQFINEILIVGILQIGIKTGVEGRQDRKFSVIEEDVNEMLVKSDDMARFVGELMSEERESEERRERAKVLSEKAKIAMEIGGSSYDNTKKLIQYVKDVGKMNLSSA